LLGVYLIASFGLIPAPRVISGWLGHLSHERYPCEDCGCGCASAHECWTNCCCHTEHERLVWAIENGVMPPPGVEFADEAWIAAANEVAPGSAHCALCVDGVLDKLRRGVATKSVHHLARTGSCCSSDSTGKSSGQGECGGECSGTCDGKCKGACDSRAAESCCSMRLDVAPAKSAASCCSKPKPSTRWPGPTISAMTCKGLAQLLMTAIPPAMQVAVVGLDLPAPPRARPQRPVDQRADSRTLEVPAPPPRMA